MRRFAVLLVAVALASTACSKPERPTLDDVAGTIGPSASDGSSGSPSTTAAGGASTTSTSPPASSGGGNEQVPPDPAAAEVVDVYFDALLAQDFEAAERASTGGARFMVRVRDLVAHYNAARDGVTELKYLERSFKVASSARDTVAYVGKARLDSRVSGPAGDPYTESELFENPVAAVQAGRWAVAAYLYKGEPLELHPASSRASVGGVELRLAGALGFGTSTGVIVDLVPDGDHSIKVEEARIRYADGSVGASTLGALISEEPAALYYRYDRSASRPVTWEGTVTVDGGTTSAVTKKVSLKFS
ncbi:MAG: hypothetical protein ACT4OV_02200 [Microthrixaceae bacterium]